MEWKDLRHCGMESHPDYEGEINDGSSITEQVYIPLKDQIEEMMMSGRMLDAYRKELYHFQPGEEVDENFSDPTMDPGFDAADAAIERARLLGKRDRMLKEQEAARKAAEEDVNESAGSTEVNDDSADVSRKGPAAKAAARGSRDKAAKDDSI